MRTCKWVALVLASGTLLQLGTCATDFVYMVLQGVATQVASGLVQQLLGTTTGAGA